VLFSLGQTKDIATRRLELYRNSTGLFTGGVSLGLGLSDGRELPALVARQTVSLQLFSPTHLALWMAFAFALVLPRCHVVRSDGHRIADLSRFQDSREEDQYN
jgi:hypothetical protein